MKLVDIVSFRKDLLFNGAVQLSWFEKDRLQAEKAAEHFVFHGPDYHGVSEADIESSSHQLVDTASFTLEILERITGKVVDEPFSLAIAGYGTGKSHLAITLATLLSNPKHEVASKILDNITMADASIGRCAKEIVAETSDRPFLVIAINGMQDFDLCGEIIRQVLFVLKHNGLDTTVLENLRPRFNSAINFTESLFLSLQKDFEERFGVGCDARDIIERLKCQDEETFKNVSYIYEQKMGSPIHAVGQESIHDFIRITKETYCGPGKPFSGMVIIFDEFGRYMEFAVQRPHIAGPGALQQLFESVQANGDRVFLLCFIQYELKAYISRIAPELRDDLNRYVTRYDAVHKVRLSTNLETLMANLLEKKNPEELERQLSGMDMPADSIQLFMNSCFPDIKNHALWMDAHRFKQVICKGCWPLHPFSTWVLYKLTSVGKSLQQRSAFSLLADVYDVYQQTVFTPGRTIRPVDICDEALISEFLASEQYGQQGATAHAYISVMQKYQHELSPSGKAVLKAVLLSAKTGVKVDSKEDSLQVLGMFAGIDIQDIVDAVHILEYEYAVLEWNDLLHQYEIAGDAVPRRAFLGSLKAKVSEIDSRRRADIFSHNYKRWLQVEAYPTDFGSQNDITTREWNFNVYFTNVSMLSGQIDYALRTWRDAKGVDEEKGQLIYCYLGPESRLSAVRENTIQVIKSSMGKNDIEWDKGAPLAVIFLDDTEGTFGDKLAEYWVLQEQMSEEESKKYANFILDRKSSLEQEMQNCFSELERARQIVFATDKPIAGSRIKNMLTQLFDVVYPKRIPFPFDGFHTARGNAAKDSQVFTKELLLGNLDRDWISARSVQQRNRAYEVLDCSWGVIGNDGSVRMIPSNDAVRSIIELLESQLGDAETSDTKKPMNMGEITRLLCSPPYGCNIASAGMILAFFIGRRKNELNLMKDNQMISFENWLQEAMPGNFFDLSVLDNTDVVRVSKESLSEWEILFDEWELEPTLNGKVRFRNKALELKERIPVPQQYHYRYELCYKNANDALRILNDVNNKIDSALDKVETGIENKDASTISWGAAMLNDVYNRMQNEDRKWAEEQKNEVAEQLAHARLHTQWYFQKWLERQTAYTIESLSKFKHYMLKIVGSNLSELGLEEERELLETHVDKVAERIQFIEELKRTASDIDKMVRNNKITNSTSVSELNAWLEQVKDFRKRLDNAKMRADIVQDDIDVAARKLADYNNACQNQLELYKERATAVFNINEINTSIDITNWQGEIASLLSVYDGQERDVEDLKLVQKQLDLIEMHYRQLDNEALSEEEFGAACRRCKEENDNEFANDAPPLDNELIYDSINKGISEKRKRIASEWMLHNVPKPEEILKYNATSAIQYKSRLQKMPLVLSQEQVKTVRERIKACERRLDELEVEGLLVKFKAMSEENKKNFLRKISDYIK
jgi:hypothetical protein